MRIAQVASNASAVEKLIISVLDRAARRDSVPLRISRTVLPSSSPA